MTAPTTTRSLRIVLAARNVWFLRLFESLVLELAARGHAVHVVADAREQKALTDAGRQAIETLVASSPRITFAWAPRDRQDEWRDLRTMVRFGLDYLRFLAPTYRSTPVLAERAAKRAPDWLVRRMRRPWWRSAAGRWWLRAGLRVVERAIPVDRALAAAVVSAAADVVLVTPLISLGSEQQDVLRVAAESGVPTALGVASWDHLSSKALIRTVPDRLFVWNEIQQREAVAFHGIPAERVVVTGAQCFDVWFGRTPTLGREAFCRRVGLDPARPYVMYACSALFEHSPSEPAFVLEWVKALRAHGGLADVQVLIRPHPKRARDWEHVGENGGDGVGDGVGDGTVLWPARGEALFGEAQKADYFDSLYHSAAVVGLNTSAMIEAGIIGRAVHTILLPEFTPNQEGTLHFRYLLQGGLLRVTRDLRAHAAQVAETLATAGDGTHVNRAFVESFVRPRGIGVAATGVFADAVEALAASRRAPRAAPRWVPLARRLLHPIAVRIDGPFAEVAARERGRAEKAVRKAAERAARASRKAAANPAKASEPGNSRLSTS